MKNLLPISCIIAVYLMSAGESVEPNGKLASIWGSIKAQ